jgi:hypothetical protein
LSLPSCVMFLRLREPPARSHRTGENARWDIAEQILQLSRVYVTTRSDQFMLVRDTIPMYQVSHYIGPRTKLAEPSRETGETCLDQWTTFCTSDYPYPPVVSPCFAHPSVQIDMRQVDLDLRPRYNEWLLKTQARIERASVRVCEVLHPYSD